MSYNAKNYTEQGGAVTRFGGSVVFEDGCTVEGLSANPLLPATADALGGIKVGSGLSIEDGVLSADVTEIPAAANQAASKAETVAGLVADFNTLLALLKAAGIMEADSAD